MNETEKLDDMIDLYLSDTMNDTVRREFEEKIASDKELALLVSLSRGMRDALSDPKAIQLEEDLSALGEEFSSNLVNRYGSPANKLKKWLLLVPIILLMGYYFKSKFSRSLDTQGLYIAYYESYPVSNQVRASDIQDATVLDNIISSFKDNAFKDVLSKVSTLKDKGSPIPNSILFYEALSHLEIGNLSEARISFESIISSGPNNYVQQSQWYLSLIELKDNNIDKVKFHLEGVLSLSSKGKYAAQARELLKELN